MGLPQSRAATGRTPRQVQLDTKMFKEAAERIEKKVQEGIADGSIFTYGAPLTFHEKQEAYDIARGAYDSDTFLQLPDMSEQRRVLVEIAGFPAAASDFTDVQVKDLYKSHIKKVKKAMLEMELAAAIPVEIDEEIVLDDAGFFDLGEEE